MPAAHDSVYTYSRQHAANEIAPANFEVPSQNQQRPTKLQRSDFERKLQRVESILPGKTDRRLLQAIQGTGPEKLREVGLRAREYKRLFHAWEQLHSVEEGPGMSFIRANMAQYIRQHTSMVVGKMTDVEQRIRTYEKYKVLMFEFEKLIAGWTAPYFVNHMTFHMNLKYGGRGIVVTAGNNQAAHLKTLIYSLRVLGCTLPIEVMYLDDDDLGVDVQRELAGLDGVITREIAPMVDDDGWKLAGWAVKPFAILFSSFREAIFIDADSMFFKDPETLFEDEDYKRTGALFFKDRALWRDSKRDWLKKVLPIPISANVLESRYWKGESGQMQESGVIVVDKWRHFIAMLIVCRMNGPDRNSDKKKGIVGVYDMVYGELAVSLDIGENPKLIDLLGDKETFWIGWELVGDTDYAFHRGRVAVMGVEGGDKSDESSDKEEPATEKLDRPGDLAKTTSEKAPAECTMCSPQMLHLGANGTPLWFNGGLLQNKFANKKEWRFASFSHFLVEPEPGSAVATWSMLGGNNACLTTNESLKHSLSKAEIVTIQEMINHTKKVL